MKTINLKTLVIFLFIFSLTVFQAQTTTATSNSVHPTVSQVKVKYKAVRQDTIVSQGIRAIPQATVNLKTTVNISRIYFCMMSGPDTIYSANYPLNSPPVYNGDFKLFERTDDKVYFSSGQAFNLKPYLVKVRTTDTLNTFSTNYTLIQ